MPKIISPFQGVSPIAQTLSNLGQSLWGDQVGGAIKRAQQEKLERENAETKNLMLRTSQGINVTDPIAQAMIIGSGYDPQKYSVINRMDAAGKSSYDPVTRAQIGAGESFGNTVSGFGQTLTETTRNNDLQSGDRRYGVDVGATTLRRGQDINSADSHYNTDQHVGEDRRNNNMQSVDRRYGTDQSIGQQQYEFNNKPMPVIDPTTHQPRYVPQSSLGAPGGNATIYEPILSDTDRKGTMVGGDPTFRSMNPNQLTYTGANDPSKTPATKTVHASDGKVYLSNDAMLAKGMDVQGNPIPLGPGTYIANVQGDAAGTGVTNAVNTDLQSKQINYRMFRSLLDQAEPLTRDPSLFGPMGAIRSKAQDLIQSVGGAATVLGAQQKFAETLTDINGQKLGPLAARQLIPELYDPRLSEVETLWGLMLYTGASALTGQSNRSVSDRDVGEMRKILGDPHSFFASNLSMASKLQTARQVIDNLQGVVTDVQQNGAGPGAATPGAPPPNVAVQPNPMRAAPPGPVEQWERDPTSGAFRRVR